MATTLTFAQAIGVARDASRKPAAKSGAKRRSILGRVIDALAASRRRKAEIEIRRCLALRGEPRDRHDYALLPFAGE